MKTKILAFILRFIVVVIAGVGLGYLIMLAMENNPCYDGRPITETPNYCFTGRAR